jgi:LL-H family phage holin
MMNDVLNQFVVETVIPIIVSVISAFVLLIVRNLNTWMKARLTNEQYAFAQSLVKAAVSAAEQYAGSGEGETKKTLVLTAVTQALQERGVKISPQELDILIEDTVRKDLAK